MTIREIYPDSKPTLFLNFAKVKALDPRLSFTRSSNATFVTESGLVSVAGVNIPRFNHNPITGESLGLFLEPQRTNLIPRSAEFDDAAWTKSGTTITSTTAIAPDGTATAERLQATATTAPHTCSQLVTVAASTSHTASVFVKTDGAPFVQVAYDNGTSVGGFINVNLATGAVTRAEAALGGTDFASGVQAFPNGWYRINLRATHTSTTGRVVISPLPAGQSTTGINPTTTTTTSDAILVWGAQLEASTFMTSYIPTVGSSATRVADVAVMGSSPWLNATEGTMVSSSFLAGIDIIQAPSESAIVTLDDGGGSNRIYHRYVAGNVGNPSFLDFIIITNNIVQVDSNGRNNIAVGNITTAASAYRLNDTESCIDGVTQDVDTSATIPAMNRLLFTCQGLAASCIRYFAYYPTRFPLIKLRALSR